MTAANEMSCMVTASAAVVGSSPAVRTRLKTRSGAVVEAWRMDEQGHQVLVEHDDEGEHQPGAHARSDEREDDLPVGLPLRRAQALRPPPRTRAAGPSSPPRSGVSISGKRAHDHREDEAPAATS